MCISNPYDVEFGYYPQEDRYHETMRVLDKRVEDKKHEFLMRVQELFDEFGIEEFHEYNDYDFDFCLLRLENKTREKLEASLCKY